MDHNEAIKLLENAWNVNGLLYQIQTGRFNEKKATEFTVLLQSIDVNDDFLPARLVALLWKIPVFLRNQNDTICSCGIDPVSYMNFYIEIDFLLERILGKP
jgi:hypothetical protein